MSSMGEALQGTLTWAQGEGGWKEWDVGLTLPVLKGWVRGQGATEEVVTAPHLLEPAGMCPGNHQGLDFILSQPQLGQAVVIIVGGAHECLSMVPGEHHLTLQEQKGFLHLALRHG